MAVFDFSTISCVPLESPDPETGCRACGDNARGDYEQCRQTFYLKKQTEVIKQNSQQTSSTSPSTNTEPVQNTKELESANTELKGMVEEQNKQITQLIQSEKENASTIKNLNTTNLALISVLVIIVVVFLTIKFVKRRNQ